MAPAALGTQHGETIGDHPSPSKEEQSSRRVGKTVRGARQGQVPAPHLLPVLLNPLDLDGAVVTADAMRTQVDTAGWVTRRGGHYPLTVKDNQKTLHRTLKTLPWKSVPSSISWVDTGHGRRVRRTVKAVKAPAWVDLPAATQVLQVRRTRTIKNRKHVEVVYPGLLPTHDRCPARGRRRLDPRPLGNREPAPPGPRRHLRRGPPPATHR